MKNKLINKFAFMFVIGLSLLFSWSHAAEIFVVGANTYTLKSNFGATKTTTTLPELSSVSSENKTQITNILTNLETNLANDSSYTDEVFENFVKVSLDYYNNMYGKNYDSYFYHVLYTDSRIKRCYFFDSSQVDVIYLLENVNFASGGSSLGRMDCTSFLPGSDYVCVWIDTSASSSNKIGATYYSGTTAGSCFSFAGQSYNVMPFKTFPMKTNISIKEASSMEYTGVNFVFEWDGTSYYQYIEEEPEGPSLITDEEFSSVLAEITSSELFYQHIPSDYRDNFYVQYDVNSENYLFYFYPSNYQVYGLLRNENDYHVICDKNFSWWDNVVDFFKKIFIRNTENLDYKMIYVKILDDGSCSFWYRSKSMLSMDETLFNFELNPIVYSSVQIPFYGQHGGGGIDIDTGDVTLATEPEYVVDNEIYGETNIVYNPTPIEKVENEQNFWDKVTNRLSSIVSEVKSFPEKIISAFGNMTGLTKIVTLISPIGSAILIVLNVLLSSISLLARAVAFVYTLPTIQASDALFLVDVDSTTGLVFAGNGWGTKFLEGLNMVKEFSWNGLNLWTLFTSFIVAMFAIHCVKLVRKHYHY